MLSCRLLGHRYRFDAEGSTMRWACERGCGAGGEKVYASAARRAPLRAPPSTATTATDIGRRAPLFGLLPLRVWRALVDRRARPG